MANPIDILATGTAEQLGIAIDYCEQKFHQIDAIAVIYGTPGLTTLYEAYDVLHQKIQTCTKPIFPILPSVHTAGPEVAEFLAKGHVNFSDEVTLATAPLADHAHTKPAPPEVQLYGIDIPELHKIIYREVNRLTFEGVTSGVSRSRHRPRGAPCAGIPLVPEMVFTSKDELTAFARKVGFPVVPRSSGPSTRATWAA